MDREIQKGVVSVFPLLHKLQNPSGLLIMPILLNKEHRITSPNKEGNPRGGMVGWTVIGEENWTTLHVNHHKPAGGSSGPICKVEAEIRWSQGHFWPCDPVIPQHTMTAV